MTGVEPANGGVTIHCLDHLATPARKDFNCFWKTIGADSGNRTRTSCLEGKGTTTMQYPLSLIISWFLSKQKAFFFKIFYFHWSELNRYSVVPRQRGGHKKNFFWKHQVPFNWDTKISSKFFPPFEKTRKFL